MLHNQSDAIIVVAHHPIYEINVEPFYSLVDSYVDLYMNGHTHLLNHYSVNGKDKYITSGAGGMVSIETTESMTHVTPSIPDIVSHDVLWTKKVAGYSRHMIDIHANGTLKL